MGIKVKTKESSWNYRLTKVKGVTKGEPWMYFGIHEVHYHGDDPIAISEGPAVVMGDSPFEVRKVLQAMLASMTEELIEFNDVAEPKDKKNTRKPARAKSKQKARHKPSNHNG